MIKDKKIIRTKNKISLRDNKGSTMLETLVAFAVLMVILVALTRLIMFSSELRMRAIDTGRILQTFNKCLYSEELKNSNSFEKVKKTHYNSDRANEERPTGGVVGPLFYITSDETGSELWVTEIEADCYTYDSSDSSVSTENLSVPNAIIFDHKKYTSQ